MNARPLGASGISVSPVGLGAGRIGGPETTDADVDRILGAALDAGVTLVDTARSYGLSEERLGRALVGRRDRFVLSTKVGYGVEGVADWTGPCIEAGVDGALGRLRTDRIDIVHLHSCGQDALESAGVVEALARTVRAGKVRVAAYSGEDEALAFAVESGAFGAVQCSVSAVDQGPLDGAVAEAQRRGVGVLAKRPLGNAPWRFATRPGEPDVAAAWDRFRALALDPGPLPWPALFARFAAHAPGVTAVLVGTTQADHLQAVARAVAEGPLDEPLARTVRAAWSRVARGWRGRV